MIAGFIFYGNIQQIDKEGAEYCQAIGEEFKSLVVQTQPEPQAENTPLFPEAETWAEIPTRNEGILIQGDLYIGLMEIPSLGLSLPIHMNMSQRNLSTAPCVYAGSLLGHDLVVAGHNYRSHFWYLKDLKSGDSIQITNPNGQVFRYVVKSQEIVHQSETAVVMDREGWDLTLYTCQYPDNTYRVVLRCVLV